MTFGLVLCYQIGNIIDTHKLYLHKYSMYVWRNNHYWRLTPNKFYCFIQNKIELLVIAFKSSGHWKEKLELSLYGF